MTKNQKVDTMDDTPETDKPGIKQDKEGDEKLPFAEKIKRWYHKLPDKKRYLEFVTALLTIPVLLTVIISNVQTLQKQKAEENISPTPTVNVRDDRPPGSPRDMNSTTPTLTPTPTVTPSAQCIKEVGPISIVYPGEGSTISTSPLCVDISRTGVDYCAVVWSYRINGENWSDYTDKSICLYGLSAGSKTMELRVKSIVTGAETILTRNFIFQGAGTPTPTSTASAYLRTEKTI